MRIDFHRCLKSNQQIRHIPDDQRCFFSPTSGLLGKVGAERLAYGTYEKCHMEVFVMLSPQKEFDKFIPEISKGKMPFQEFFPLQDCHRPLPMIRFSSPHGKIFTLREQEGEVKSANQAKAMEVQS